MCVAGGIERREERQQRQAAAGERRGRCRHVLFLLTMNGMRAGCPVPEKTGRVERESKVGEKRVYKKEMPSP